MNDDIQLFIIWNRGRRLEKEILTDIRTKFEVIKILEISWSKQHFAHNLARFYGKNLRKGRKKIRECGTGPFLVVVVRDKNPLCTNGKNFNMSSTKYFYRQMFGGGFMVHASDNSAEAFENFLLLTGQNIIEFADLPICNDIVPLKADLIGTEGWKDADSIIKMISLLPENKLDCNNEIWTLKSTNPEQSRRILNAQKCWFGRRLYTLNIKGRKQKIKICPFS